MGEPEWCLFEGDKTAFIHFTRNSRQSADEPISVKGERVRPTSSVKILGLIMDSRLQYQDFELGQKAKQLAQRSTDEERVVTGRPRLTRSMV